jgi:predicted transcriptional regulator
MRGKMKYLVIIASLLFMSFPVMAELPVGEVPPLITLEGKDGGRLDGSSWSSAEIKGRMFTFWYVDPDEADMNDHVSERLKNEEFPEEALGSIAIINMAAAPWKPNFAIESALKDKQEEFPNTLYLKDFKKVLVKKWGLKDDSSDIMLFSREGKVLFSKDGKLSSEDVEALIAAIKENL